MTLIGHGLRERQVRGPASVTAPPGTSPLCCRRYRCLECSAVILVVPQGIAPRRRFAAGAIALGLFVYGVAATTAFETGERIGLVGHSDQSRARTLSRWSAAVMRGELFGRLRLQESGASPRRRAGVVTRALGALMPSSEGSPEERAFAGGVLAA